MWYVDEINIHVLALCSFCDEVIIHLILESFNGVIRVLNYMHKTFVEDYFFTCFKIWRYFFVTQNFTKCFQIYYEL